MRRLELLRIEHRDLDSAIGALVDSGSGDQMQVARLKKRKLRLRDEMALLEDQLVPDIIACLAGRIMAAAIPTDPHCDTSGFKGPSRACQGVRSDRKSGVSGKSVLVRVGLGGRRIIKHKIKRINNNY